MEHTPDGVATATRAHGGWAEVRTADHVTRYLRLGRGSRTPIIILTPASADAAIWPEVFDVLAEHHRIYLPDLPDAEESLAPRARGFLDGLGLPPVILMAPSTFCVPALELALLEPERIHKLILVPTGAAAETGLSGVLATTPTRTTSVLLVRRDSPADEAVGLVTNFLAQG